MTESLYGLKRLQYRYIACFSNAWNVIFPRIRFYAGVYVGCMYHEYIDLMAGSGVALPPQAFIGNGPPYLVGRLSYTFGFTGPCVSTDTACSSSLVATHLAAKAILHGEEDAAVAAGVNAMLLAETTAGISQLQALSAVGRCR